MNATRVLGVVVIGLAGIACAAKREPAVPVSRQVAEPSSIAGGTDTTGGQADRATEPAATRGRMIARSATLRLVVADPAGISETITNQIEARGGFVSESKLWQEAGQARALLTIRVPTQELGPVLKLIRKAALRIETETISSQDVTSEYSDLSAQATNLEATEKELRTLLASVRERTQKASDVLEVFSHLSKVRSDIDRTKARIVVLAQLVDLSTVTLELVPDALARPVVEPGWSPVPVLKSASRALVATLKWLAEAAIWIIVYVLPLVALLVGLSLGIRSVIRALRHRGLGPPTA